MRNKIDYGIYLGLEYACICQMEKSVPVIKKIDVTDDSMPCCVFFNRRGGTVVGASAYRSMKSDKKIATKTWKIEGTNTFVEFQRTMGSDVIYHSKNMEDKGLKADYTSEELSAEVLKALKSYITDESFRSVVVTIPAKFTVNQKTATKQAAKLAGFDYCELLEKPACINLDKNCVYQTLNIQISRMESKLAPNLWASEFKTINKTGSVIELDMPSTFFAEYEIFAYTESGTQISIYPSIIIIDNNNNLNNYKYGKNQN